MASHAAVLPWTSSQGWIGHQQLKAELSTRACIELIQQSGNRRPANAVSVKVEISSREPDDNDNGKQGDDNPENVRKSILRDQGGCPSGC
jgi:hypothetical protein